MRLSRLTIALAMGGGILCLPPLALAEPTIELSSPPTALAPAPIAPAVAGATPPAAGTKNGDDCFVRFDDGHTTFKRVFFEKDEHGKAVLRLQPRNEKYRAQTVPSERVSGLYKATFKYQRVDED